MCVCVVAACISTVNDDCFGNRRLVSRFGSVFESPGFEIFSLLNAKIVDKTD